MELFPFVFLAVYFFLMFFLMYLLYIPLIVPLLVTPPSTLTSSPLSFFSEWVGASWVFPLPHQVSVSLGAPSPTEANKAVHLEEHIPCTGNIKAALWVSLGIQG